MKTRRAFQIILGILSLLVAAALLLAASAYLFLTFARDDLFETQITIATTIYHGICSIGLLVGLTGELVILVPALFYGLPFVLLLVGAILLFLHKTDKQGKYVAGSILALTGATICSVFTITFAPEILSGHVANYESEIILLMMDSSLYVRIAFGSLLALFVAATGCALGIKPKREAASETTDDAATTAEDEVTEETAEEDVVTTEPRVHETRVFEPATPKAERVTAPRSTETPENEYVPNTDVTVHDVVQNTYGTSDETLSPATVAKINKLRGLYEAGAITQAEYLRLVNLFLGKK